MLYKEEAFFLSARAAIPAYHIQHKKDGRFVVAHCGFKLQQWACSHHTYPETQRFPPIPICEKCQAQYPNIIYVKLGEDTRKVKILDLSGDIDDGGYLLLDIVGAPYFYRILETDNDGKHPIYTITEKS